MSLFEEISHESVRRYYHKLKYILKQPRKKERKFIAIDETIVRVGGLESVCMGCNRRRNERMFGNMGFYGQTSIYSF